MVFSHLWTNTWTLPSSSRVDHSLCGRSRRGSSRKLHLISLSSGITYWYWRWRIFDYLYGGTQRHSCCSLIFWHQILFQVIFKDLFGPYGWSLFVLPKHKKHKVQTIFQILLITLFLIWVCFHQLVCLCFPFPFILMLHNYHHHHHHRYQIILERCLFSFLGACPKETSNAYWHQWQKSLQMTFWNEFEFFFQIFEMTFWKVISND